MHRNDKKDVTCELNHVYYAGGDERIRTAGAAFAEPCLTTWRRRPIEYKKMERETGIEPATNSLEGCDSTTELLPLRTSP